MPESGPVTVCRYEVWNSFEQHMCWMYTTSLSVPHQPDMLLLARTRSTTRGSTIC